MLQFPHGARTHPLGPQERLRPTQDLRLHSAACSQKLKGLGRVAVVGGGLAGLMAARQLVRMGVAVSLFEAREFVGGRVHSNRTFSKGRVIEEGAELIGSFHTRWLELAREFGLAMVSRMESDLYEREGLDSQLVLESRPLDRKTFKALSLAMDERVLKPLAELAQRITHPSQPWLQATLTHRGKTWALRDLDRMAVEAALPQFCQITARGHNPGDELLWKLLDFKLVNDEVSPLDEMNFLGLLCKVRAGQGERMVPDLPVNAEAYWDELEIFRCADGCDALATRLAAAIQTPQYGPVPAKLARLVAVTQIQITRLGVALGLKATRPDGRFKDDKTTVLPGFSNVILAIPPSVWARVEITVDGRKVDPADASEIGPLQMNDAVKHFSPLKERFWIKSGMAPSGGTARGGQVWEGTDNQTRVGDQGIVLSVFAGPVSAGRKAPTEADIDNGLRSLYPGTPGHPGYASHLAGKPLFADWPNKPFIKTGYWSPRPGDIFKVSQKLTQPFHQRLFFAGEHTDTGFFGYMEGALRSGERAARTLMLQACDLRDKEADGPARVAESADEAEPGPQDETVSLDGHDAVPVWNGSDENEQDPERETEGRPLPGAEVNAESAADLEDEQLDASAPG